MSFYLPKTDIADDTSSCKYCGSTLNIQHTVFKLLCPNCPFVDSERDCLVCTVCPFRCQDCELPLRGLFRGVIKLKTINGIKNYYEFNCLCRNKILAFEDLPCKQIQVINGFRLAFDWSFKLLVKSYNDSIQSETFKLKKQEIYTKIPNLSVDDALVLLKSLFKETQQYFAEKLDIQFLVKNNSWLSNFLLPHFLFVKVTNKDLKSLYTNSRFDAPYQYELGLNHAVTFNKNSDICSKNSGLHVTTIDGMAYHWRYLKDWQLEKNLGYSLLIIQLPFDAKCVWSQPMCKLGVSKLIVVKAINFFDGGELGIVSDFTWVF